MSCSKCDCKEKLSKLNNFCFQSWTTFSYSHTKGGLLGGAIARQFGANLGDSGGLYFASVVVPSACMASLPCFPTHILHQLQ
jgi:hypothetical protein